MQEKGETIEEEGLIRKRSLRSGEGQSAVLDTTCGSSTSGELVTRKPIDLLGALRAYASCTILPYSDAHLGSQSRRGLGQSLQGHKDEQGSDLCLSGPWALAGCPPSSKHSGCTTCPIPLAAGCWLHSVPCQLGTGTRATEIQMPMLCITGCVARDR